MQKKYSIGLDIGTTSVGWSVINEENYKLIKKGNRNLWGVRLFDEAIQADKRRNYRSTRRRLDRRRNRIKLLQDEFQNEINKVDNNFYTKLKESFYNENDSINKTLKLSSDEKLQIKKYYEKYPTIYHLRNELITNSDKKDIRLVYLALHHIIKYRGSFQYEGSNFNVSNLNIKEKLKECMISIYENCDELSFSHDYIEAIDYDNVETSLLLPSKNDIKVELQKELSSFFPKKSLEEIKKMLVGNQFTIPKLFNIELNEDMKLSFSDSKYDENVEKLEISDEKLEVINHFKEIYDIVFLKKIFKNADNTAISSLKIKRYEKHKKDLKYLKEVFKYDRNLYRELFKTNSKKTCLYDQYIHNKLNYDDFIKELNKLLDKIWDKVDNQNLIDKYETEIKESINTSNFLPRITETDNGKFPYQLNEEELRTILENQGKYYPFLLEKVDKEYKLIKLFKFRIPYYVGPLNNFSEFSWLKKVSDDKITPYNFNEVIDKEESALRFIDRMLGECSYLFGEKAMANNSITCCKFKVLNELKQIRVNNEKLPNNFIIRVIDELFKKDIGPITDIKFKKFLYLSGEYDMYKGDIEVKGYSAENKFANNMNSYIDFFEEDGFFKDTEYTKNDAEEIIRWITIFEDKDILKSKILKQYPELNGVIDKIVEKKYKGWSHLSKRLITEKYYVDKKTNIKKSILDLMYETDENFMQILNNKEYDFESMINSINSKTLKVDTNKLNYEVVQELATSPATKRGIWQSLLVVKEIVKYMGYEPSSISIEMSRGDEKKKRTDDRKKYIEKLYDKCKKNIENYQQLNNELRDIDKIDSEKLFLYFIQEGKSLYSGIKLNIEDLNSYEVDHIIPQSLIKDDSIENKALVLKKENQDKAANLVLPSKYRDNCKSWWEKLKANKLISSKKFHNLIRKAYSEKDIEGFINRQLVETRQITKHVANIFKNYYKDTKVIYLPASLSHNYREKFEMYKYRDLNDYHHAHDAYLAAVLGQYKEHFKHNINFEKLKEITKNLYKENKYKEVKYGYVINSIDNEFVKYNDETGEIRFDTDEFNKTVCNTLYQNDVLISKKTEVKTGEFYKETIFPKKSVYAKYKLKDSLPVEIYGGYNNIFTSFMKLIKYKQKNKTKNILVGIPILLTANKDSQNLIDNYIKTSLKCDEYEIVFDNIPYNIEIIYNNQLCAITGCGIGSSEVINATQFKLKKDEQIKYKYLLNFIFNHKYPSRYNFIDYESSTLEEWHKHCNEIFNEEINSFYDLFVNRIKEKYPMYEKIANNLESIKDEFYTLPLTLKDNTKEMSKVDVIKELFKLTKCNSTNANLSNLKCSVKFYSRMGRCSGANIQTGTIINKSVTGLWERRRDF